MTTITITVTLNGTATNQWHRWGLTQNPFPQLARAEYDAGERQLASLDGDPITSADDIRERLAGFDDKFVAGCIARWKPGERVRFVVTFPEERHHATA